MFDTLESLFNHIKSNRDAVNIIEETSVVCDFKIKKMDVGDWKTVSIIINNYNRKQYLEKLIVYLKNKGYENIYIIDNNSSYQPLLEFYKKNRLKVFYLSENVGYLALWKTTVYDYFSGDYYVYTDSDVVPSNSVPENFIAVFASMLQDYSFLDKMGFSLDIEDLPEEFSVSRKIIKDELKFWIYDIEDKFYFSPIDTTFALYRPNSKGGWWLNAGRAKKPYVAKHLPWYENPKELSEDAKYYYKTIDTSSTLTRWSKFKKNKGIILRVKSYLRKFKKIAQ